jgi:hypothetical protein
MISLSPRIHAGDARPVPSDRLGAGEETPAPCGPESVAVQVFATCCGQPVAVTELHSGPVDTSTRGWRTPVGSISYCRICGLHGPFRLQLLLPGQARFVGVA